MSNQTANRQAWHDRWSEPTLEQLLAPLKSHHRRTLNYVIDALSQMEGVTRSIAWYAAWQWTIHYTMPGAATGLVPGVTGSAGAAGGASGGGGGGGGGGVAGRMGKSPEAQSLCYLVPRIDSPMVCVPLSDAALRELPLARLNKYVRDGIKMAKCAVTIHWAIWTPVSQAEALLLIDLLKRRHKTAAQGELVSKSK